MRISDWSSDLCSSDLRLRRTRRGNPRDPRLESRDGNACLAKVAKKGCADNGLQYREILLLSCYQRPPLDPALLPPSQRLSPARCHPRRAKEKEQCLVGTAPDFLPFP